MLRKFLKLALGWPVDTNSNSSTTSQATHGSGKQGNDQWLIRRESRVGSSLFGQVPSGHHREFFCLDQDTWVWFEEWKDARTNQHMQMNVLYELQPRGILKVVNGEPRGYVEGQELVNLTNAMKTYARRISTEVYGYASA